MDTQNADEIDEFLKSRQWIYGIAGVWAIIALIVVVWVLVKTWCLTG